MTDPEPDVRVRRLEQRAAALTREVKELRTAAQYAGQAALARTLSIGVLVLTAVPWLDYSTEDYRQGDWYTALGLVGRGSAVVDDRIQPVAVAVLLVAVLVAAAVPLDLRFSWVSGAVAVLAVVAVLSTKHADGEYATYSWSPAPGLCLLLAIALVVVQLSAPRRSRP